ncbi:low molecular weight phosphotyrosine protein phosphatase [bacterium]|nr:low molecular weight phosphotyrosine protein phosphatase [bacterium]
MSREAAEVSRVTSQILFICLGNICRSPLAEGICEAKLRERGLSDSYSVDSCGTGSWHVGSPPHEESQRVARERGIDISGQSSRQLVRNDREQFDLFIVMDQKNLNDTRQLLGKETRIHLLREFDPEPHSMDVPDPYYSDPDSPGDDGFEQVYAIIDRSLDGLLDLLEQENTSK